MEEFHRSPDRRATPRRPVPILEKFIPNRTLKLMDQCREVFRFYHYALRTEEAYSDWIRRFIHFHQKRHPKDLGAREVAAFLSHLASDLKVAPATQAQALNALVFLYRDVLIQPLGPLGEWGRQSRPKHLPTVLTREQVLKLLACAPPPGQHVRRQ